MDIIGHGTKLVRELNDTGSVKVGAFIIRKLDNEHKFVLFGPEGGILGEYYLARSAVAEAFKRSL